MFLHNAVANRRRAHPSPSLPLFTAPPLTYEKCTPIATPSLTRILFGEVKIVSQPFSRHDLVHGQTRVAVRQGQEEIPSTKHNGQDESYSSPRREKALAGELFARWEMLLGTCGNALLARSGQQGVVEDWLHVEDEFQESSCD